MSSGGIRWIEGQPRTPPSEREYTSKFDASVANTVSDIKRELDRMGVDDYTPHIGNGHTKSDGFPLHNANPDDPGFSLFWSKDGNTRAVACDHYTTLAANLRCVYLWIKETRMSGNRPVTTGRGAFAAAALPGETEDPVSGSMTEAEARDVLNVTRGMPTAALEKVAQEQIKKAHPDHGGGEERLKKVRRAREVLLR